MQLARLAGATTIILSTRQASRRALAEDLGATATVDPCSGDLIDAVAGPAGLMPGGVDVVLECAGVRETVEQSMRLARAGGTVVIVGVMPQGMKAEFEPFDLLFRELKVLGSFLNPFTHRRAAELIASGAIEVDRLISRQVALEEAPAVIANPPAPAKSRCWWCRARVELRLSGCPFGHAVIATPTAFLQEPTEISSFAAWKKKPRASRPRPF